VIEISPGWNRYWRALCPDYRSVDYPDFDICRDRTDDQYSIVIADQVLEHVQRPLAAAANIHAMTKPGGWAMIATPFLFRVHARPHDYNRWTPQGLKQVLVEGGFAEDGVLVSGWGNKACAKAHIGGPVRAAVAAIRTGTLVEIGLGLTAILMVSIFGMLDPSGSD